jgi:cbb3-type cytochrome oxidase subunit 3
MPTIFLIAILIVFAIAIGIYWTAKKASGDEPKSQIMDESIDAKRSKGEHVDA